MDLSNWMGHMPPSFYRRKINEVIIPGSWQSSAYQSNLMKQCHAKSLAQQLVAGIRYLDLRVIFRDKKYYLSSLPLTDALVQITTFCYSHPNEVLLVNLTCESDKEDLLNLVIASWRNLLHPNILSGRFYATIREMVQSGQKIVLFSDYAPEHVQYFVWPGDIIHSSCLETSSHQDKITSLVNHLETASQSNTCIYHLPWILSPTLCDYIIASIAKRRIVNYRHLSQEFNYSFPDFLRCYERFILDKIRIISFVWWEDTNLIMDVIRLNLKLEETSRTIDPYGPYSRFSNEDSEIFP